MEKRQLVLLSRILVSLMLLILISLAPVSHTVRCAALMLPYLLVGGDVLWRAACGLAGRELFDECLLMSLATLGALVLGFAGRGECTEAVAVMLFYQTGELFTSLALARSRRSVSALMGIRPDSARLVLGGDELSVPPEEVPPGSLIRVRAGERIPLDGCILSGRTDLDISALTGESMPVSRGEGDEVPAGSICLSGELTVQTTRPFAQSTVCRILELAENAAASKSRSERFITRFARIYTPAVCAAALALGLLVPAIRALAGLPHGMTLWLYRALSFLVAACPCALVISVPLAYFCGIGAASRAGVLIKGANALESLCSIKTLVLDKTGTLTCGRFGLREVMPQDVSPAELVRLAASAESGSTHPIADCLREAAEGPLSPASDFCALPGLGVSATVEGCRVLVGNEALLRQNGIEPVLARAVGTALYVAREGRFIGALVISDTLRPGLAHTLSRLSSRGVRQFCLLTGDSTEAADAVADALGIPLRAGGLLPQDKVEAVQELLGQGMLAFVGDGINDAPVLMRSDIGIAMGGLGSDAAMEAADVVLMDDSLDKLCTAMDISSKCRRIVRQNVVFSLAAKGACLLLVALGLAGMWLAVFADVGVMVLAVLNAVRAMRIKRRG